MTLVSGPILDASGDPIPGAVLTLAPPYKAAKARVPGTVVAEPLTATADGAGVVSFVGLPGRMVGEIRAGGRRWPIELIIPDQSTAALADCVEAGAIEIPPASVAAAQAARDQALEAVAGIDDIVTAAVADAMAGIGGGYQPLSAVLTATTASYTTAEKSKLSLISAGATANQSDAYLLNRANHTGSQLAATISDLSTAVGAMITAQTGIAGGLASLDGTGRVPSSQLPSFVDDVVEAANFGALPGSGEAGKIYVTLDSNKVYRWSGSAYVEISASPGSTDAVTEGATNLYFTSGRVRTSTLTGYVAAASRTALAASDSVLGAMNKIGKWLADLAPVAVSGAWADLTGRPTTLSGAGITDGITASAVAAGYQPLDPGLTALGGLSSPGLYYLSDADTWSKVIVGSNLTFSGGTLAATSGGLTDGDKGDVIVSGGGATLALDYAAVNPVIAPAWPNVSGKPSSLAGYGITDAFADCFRGNVCWWAWTWAGTATLSSFRTNSGLTSGGTLTAAPVSNSAYGNIPKAEYLVTVAAAGAVAGFRANGTSQFYVGGPSAGVGGFSYVGVWGPATGCSNTSMRGWWGLGVQSLSDADPSASTNCVQMGWDSTDANVQMMCNDASGTCTKVDLGASFPVPTTDRSVMYRLEMYSPPGTTQRVDYVVTDLISGAVASGTLSGNLPATSTAMAIRGGVSTGGATDVAGIACGVIAIKQGA